MSNRYIPRHNEKIQRERRRRSPRRITPKSGILTNIKLLVSRSPQTSGDNTARSPYSPSSSHPLVCSALPEIGCIQRVHPQSSFLDEFTGLPTSRLFRIRCNERAPDARECLLFCRKFDFSVR